MNVLIILTIIATVMVILYILIQNTNLGGSRVPSPSPEQKGVPIASQKASSLQIVNATKEDYLHVFLGVPTGASWSGSDSMGPLSNADALTWEGGNEWAPLGAGTALEVLIIKGDSIILDIPDAHIAWRVTPLKFQDSKYSKKLTLQEGSHSGAIARLVFQDQQPILVEGGKEVVADTSAVDGINFNINYQLSADKSTAQSPAYMTAYTYGNACDGSTIDAAGGCKNPAKDDERCEGGPSAYCVPCCPGVFYGHSDSNPGSACTALSCQQNCSFTKCSAALFAQPPTDNPARIFWDRGAHIVNPRDAVYTLGTAGSLDGGKSPDNKYDPPVKAWIGNSHNLQPNSLLAHFCRQVNGEGDFTTYCYDYNDAGSSPTLKPPYKLKITYSDLGS